jgi:hypothetical protein
MVDQLQFDTVVHTDARVAGASVAACASCHQPLASEYYDINGHPMCVPCHGRIAPLTETPRGAGPMLLAALFGLGAGIAGAIIYYAVIAITNFEIGIVAILIGYMVGYAVRKGAGGRGGRRFQVLAVALTYCAVALAYLPIAVKAAARQTQSTHTATAASADVSKPASKVSPVTAIAVLIGLTFALPVIVVIGGLPSSLLSAAIIFFGMKQAWKMTGVPALLINGPYRVGATPAVTT